MHLWICQKKGIEILSVFKMRRLPSKPIRDQIIQSRQGLHDQTHKRGQGEARPIAPSMFHRLSANGHQPPTNQIGAGQSRSQNTSRRTTE